MKEHTHKDDCDNDPFWTLDQELAAVSLFDQDFTARLTAHVAEEAYTPQMTRREITPLAAPRGLRDYVLIHRYILLPAITLEADLHAASPEEGVVGRVTASRWEGMRHERIGDGQAWFYRADQVLVLWECLLFPRYRDNDPSQDPNLHALWQGFERFLTARFPAARTIATPPFEPAYEQKEWHEFLDQLGYRRLNQQAFAKEVVRRSNRRTGSAVRPLECDGLGSTISRWCLATSCRIRRGGKQLPISYQVALS